MKAPDDAVCTEQVGAMDQLKLWEIYQDYWCEHKPSITVYYKDSDFLEAGQWVYNKIDKISGISFLPYSDHTYQQAPYEEITAEQYQEMLEAMPQDVDWSSLNVYEKEDTTTGSQTMACTGGVCEIVDLVEEN
jgi:ribonucleoside-diphosphate reductase alpha chain